MTSFLYNQFIWYVCTLSDPTKKIPVSFFPCHHEFSVDEIPANSQESLIVA